MGYNMWAWALCLCAAFLGAESAGPGAARLVCYVETARATEGFSECTHLVYAGDARGEKLDSLLKEYRKNNPRLKIVLRVAEGDKDLRTLVKSKHVQGLEIYDAHKSLNKSKILETVEEARTALSSSGGGPLFLALPANPELLAKYYDLRVLVKKVDLMMVQTHALGSMKKMTYHPSRLSGLWDMMNTDSVVDLVVGLGVPASKVVISLPATARQFTLVNETLSTPGSPAQDDEPKEIDQAELCRLLQKGRWTLERDQDLSGPYAFKNTTWIAFEDSSSVDVKGKYARVRGLAGIALHKADRDTETPCGPSLKQSLAKVLNQQSRAPRAAVLRSLEHEILSAPGHARALDALQVSPYRITQVVDSDGVIHSIREDTRTEFTCSRQGYFVHPRSCARFYRCVKFDQLSPEYTVFEFDCPAGLAFDNRYEVCVWPGSLPHSQACPGSSEIAPVPQTRFICPDQEGYYADPENCRWFFACLDHGKAPLTAYEFRCPFGLGFDAARLKCDWPWLVPACGNIARYEAEAHGFSTAALTGAVGFQGQTADSINVAAHQSLVSGASLNNLVGIQSGFLTKDDSLDSNFIASQELSNGAYSGGHGFEISHGSSGFGAGQSQGLAYQAGDATFAQGNVGLVQPTKYTDQGKYTSGSIILDDYRLPTKHGQGQAQNILQSNLQQAGQYNGYNGYSTGNVGKIQYQKVESGSYDDNSGAYVHDPSGDYAEPYRHEDAPAVPYVHDDSGYKQSSDYYDVNRYSGSSQGGYGGKYIQQGGYGGKYEEGNGGQYVHDNSGAYVETGSSGSAYSGNAGSYSYSNENSGAYSGTGGVSGISGSYSYSNGGYNDNSGAYNADNSGSYKDDNSGQYVAGVYRADGHIGSGNGASSGESHSQTTYHGTYSTSNSGNYLSDSKAYTGASHTLTAGAINVGLVGKTTLVDADYSNQGGYQDGSNGYSFGSTVSHGATHQTVYPGHVSYISQPSVSIHHLGTDGNNLDGYGFVTTPTSSGVPTTATPFAVTTAIPITTYKTTFVPEPPRSSIKQIFTQAQPTVTYVKPAVVAVQQYVTPKVEVSNYNQGINVNNGYSYSSGDYSTQATTKSESSGYEYNKPSVKFEEGVTYSTPAPVVSVSTYKPQGFGHSQQTLHKVESVGFEYSTPIPVREEPFKKIVAYTTGPSVSTYVQPTVATVPQSFSHQTIHKVETNAYAPSVEVGVGNDYSQSEITYQQPETVVQYTTAQPAVVSSTFAPQVISHQTYYKVDSSKINAYSQSSESGYEYQQPETKFDEGAKTVFEYSTPAPVVSSTYKPQVYSQQTIHKFETQHGPVSSTPSPQIQISYQQPAVTIYENPLIKYTQEATPITYVESSHKPQSYSHQTIHKTETKAYSPSVEVGSYESGISYEQPAVVQHYTTAQPAIAVQQVVSTYQPQVISHQTLHKVEASKVNTYSQEAQSGYEYQKPAASYEESGYEYNKPAIKYEEAPKTYIQYSTPAPIKYEEAPKAYVQYSTSAPVQVSTYKPQTYSHQTIHKVETQNYVPVSSTAKPQVQVAYEQPTVSVYQNPLLKYTETAVTPAATVTYKPYIAQHEVTHVKHPVQYEANDQQSFSHQNIQFSQEGYSYSQPEIQRDESLNAAKSYSDASVVSHQVFHLSNVQAEPQQVFVSTSPSTVAYEQQYNDYESASKETYKAPEFIPPKTDYQQSYSVSSTASTPIVQHHSSVYHQTQDQSDYKSAGYSQQYDTVPSVPVQQVSFSTSHVTQPRKESIHLSTFPGTKVTTKYKQVGYQSPEIQVAYKAEEYLPPVVSTEVPYIVSSTYQPSTYSTASTTREYLPPVSSTTARPIVKSTTQAPTYKFVESTTKYQAPDYLPPQENSDSKTVHFESFGFNNYDGYDSKVQYNPYKEYKAPEVTVVSSTYAPVQRKQNIVVETAKSHLLGFGTVGPDAGLVSSTSYTTSAPVVSSTYRPAVKYTTSAPTYKYVESTTQYKAPEYLPPSDETETANFGSFGYKNIESSKAIRYNPYEESVQTYQAPAQRKQNIVVQTAKSQASYTTSTPVVISSEVYSVPQAVSTPVYKQELVEVTPSPIPVRRTKPKVAVVTKINDFNPLLVRKLGAVCSCQSPVLVLKGKRPNVQVQQDFDDYSNDYDGRGDISDNQWAQKTSRLRIHSQAATAAPVVTSTFNPIIVPDDSYYQDLQEQDGYESRGKQVYSESYVSSTPAVFSTTEKIVRIKPRVTAVTVAPTYKTVLLNQEVAPSAITKQSSGEATVVESQAFDRYGPGGWRSRDETLQGSVDCQRAGLFRHPKQCNKFYACRWDCTKQRFTLHVFNCPVQLSFDESLGACNWPSQGPACQGDTLLTNTL